MLRRVLIFGNRSHEATRTLALAAPFEGDGSRLVQERLPLDYRANVNMMAKVRMSPQEPLIQRTPGLDPIAG